MTVVWFTLGLVAVLFVGVLVPGVAYGAGYRRADRERHRWFNDWYRAAIKTQREVALLAPDDATRLHAQNRILKRKCILLAQKYGASAKSKRIDRASIYTDSMFEVARMVALIAKQTETKR